MTTKLAFNQIDGMAVNVKDFGAVGDGVTNDGQAFVDADAAATALGGAAISVPPGTYIISSTFVLGAGNSLIGQARGSTIIKQINTSVDGIQLSGVNTIRNIRIEAPSGNVNTTTVGINSSGTSDNIIEQVRVLYFGFGVKSTGLTWRQSYIHVRVENPTNTGFHFEETNSHLEIYLLQCYVVNNSTLGLTNKISYYISGSKGTYMNNCTSDGGSAVGTNNTGMSVINSNVVMDTSHWEGYDVPAGAIPGTDMDSLIHVKGSELIINGLHCQAITPATAAVGAVVYGEDSSRIVINNVVLNNSTLTAYTTQHVGLSHGFGDNLCEMQGGLRELVLKEAGSAAGTAKFTRAGLEDKRTSDTVSFTIDVNTLGSIVFIGSSGDLTDLTNQHSDGQRVRIVHRLVGVTVKQGRLRMQSGGDFTATSNAMQVFEYSSEGDFWSEVSHVA